MQLVTTTLQDFSLEELTVFVSFFPRPKLFFISAALWALFAVLFWNFAGEQLGAYFGLPPAASRCAAGYRRGALCIQAVYLAVYLFRRFRCCISSFWMWYAPHRWQKWSILGSALIIFNTYFTVQISRCLQRMAWAVLRSLSGGSYDTGFCFSGGVYLAKRAVCRNSIPVA